MNTYLIYSKNLSLINKEIDKIIDSKEEKVIYDLDNSSINELLNDALSISMFSNKKYIICKNTNFLLSTNTISDEDQKYLTNYLNDNNKINTIIFTVLSDKLDDRKKIVKLFREKTKVIEIEEIKDSTIFAKEEFKKNGYLISTLDASYFINKVGNNVDIILNEIEKMIIYKDIEKEITKEDIDKISSRAFKDNIFELIEAVVNKDRSKIFDLYNDLILLKEDEIKIIVMLANRFRLILQVKIGLSKGDNQYEIAKKLQSHPYPILLASKINIKQEDLTRYLKTLADMNYKIVTGQIDKKIALQSFFFEL
ncbi:MAG TPA: DNA polymerase III subunit delta [Bacilli bacterium]|nr:DNA polymerase III subunit delta [Bacilli bacterium]